ncbi:MAG TPA: pyruvate, phosphate dikinase [Candidatus Limnocylindrales bacterium]|nr:pyruvate, phosphate dikinase [Candidatus Limnocylindrales bacterium]
MSRFVYALDEPHGETLDEAKALVGGKAANLGVMARDLVLPVPPGFAITTQTCRAFLADGWPEGLEDEIRASMAEVEGKVGRRFGDPKDPLLVSVRSGAPVSMPGMMDTILDLGLNDETAHGLGEVARDAAFAEECRRRFVESFRSIVGIQEVPLEPWAQLRLAIEAVFRSWQSDRAKTYRQKEGIPDDMGTAVTVQAMVFGNRGSNSGTGVLFTRNPATGETTLYGDVLFDAQGEDVVAGTHQTESIAVLDTRLPAVARELRAAAERLEHHYADLCDIEFTIEDGKLWLLQVRVGKRSPQAALRIAVDMAQDEDFPLTREQAVRRVLPLLADPPRVATGRASDAEPLTTGLAASPGVASGPIVTDPDAAVRSAEGGTPAILVRAETSPDDVHGMSRAAGILTSRGGLASHAAVVARGWGIPAVVGAEGVEVGDGEIRIDGRALRVGDVITIDGGTGEVFEGAIDGATEIAPEAETLIGWAREAGIDIGSDQPEHDVPIVDTAPADPDRVLRAIAIKGFALPDGIADATSASPDGVRSLVETMVTDGLVESAAGAYKLTEAGRARSEELLAAERDSWGVDHATGALDAFIDIDHRVKEVVTAWQMRDHQTVNDHTDADYDAGVLDRLREIHADATAWLAPIEPTLPRLGDYRARLIRALEAAQSGDGRYVASPRVDSYHGIWFELHEDLIQLAGRTREEETAAGRA